jgi:hypothetical protein
MVSVYPHRYRSRSRLAIAPPSPGTLSPLTPGGPLTPDAPRRQPPSPPEPRPLPSRTLETVPTCPAGADGQTETRNCRSPLPSRPADARKPEPMDTPKRGTAEPVSCRSPRPHPPELPEPVSR